MAVSKRLRMEILRRDNYTCRYCGGTAPDVKLTIDHVTPVTLGGTDEPGNLVAACADCNAGKSSIPADAALVDDVAQDALRWGAAMERAAEILAERRKAAEQDNDLLDWQWRSVVVGFNNVPRWRPVDWLHTIEQFRAAGLSDERMAHAMFVAGSKRGLGTEAYWRYFCGVCWRMIGELQEVARSLIASEEDDA